MRYYVQFLQLNTKGIIDTALGSDGVFILDGRNSLSIMVDDAFNRMYKLRLIHPHYIGFRIYKGTRFDDSNPIVYEYVKEIANDPL